MELNQALFCFLSVQAIVYSLALGFDMINKMIE